MTKSILQKIKVKGKSSDHGGDRTPLGPIAPKPKSWREVIKIHPAAELFPRLSNDELLTLGKSIKAEGLRNPAAIWRDGSNEDKDAPEYLIGGVNRLDAMEQVGIQVIGKDGKLDLEKFRPRGLAGVGRDRVEYHYRPWVGMAHLLLGGVSRAKKTENSGTDPFEYVIAENITRRQLTGEQKRELISKLLQAKPAMSDRAIGEMAKADHKTVGKQRSRLEQTGEIPQLAKIIGADNKSRSRPKPAPRKGTIKITGTLPGPNPEKARDTWRSLPASESANETEHMVEPKTNGVAGTPSPIQEPVASALEPTAAEPASEIVATLLRLLDLTRGIRVHFGGALGGDIRCLAEIREAVQSGSLPPEQFQHALDVLKAINKFVAKDVREANRLAKLQVREAEKQAKRAAKAKAAS
jgi:hypothetical protein